MAIRPWTRTDHSHSTASPIIPFRRRDAFLAGQPDILTCYEHLPARRLLRSTTKAPCSLAANRVLVDNGRWLVRFQFSRATAFSSRVFNVFFGLQVMAS